ncbi:MAG: type II toxin-antitoxin system HicB family antitoxin [Acidaminococcaceae bacterium]|jgi:predicted RNase H-like HicB family nuclease|nr:type II toxin-antitoxin system HicB family antitoxin [Acidaminococcaceae bacterium]
MRYNYPAIFEQDTKGNYLVEFPDLEGCYTDGKNLTEALDNAKDVLNLVLWDMEERKNIIPAASMPNQIKISKDKFVTIISADTLAYRKIHDKKAVKKTLSIPRWLDTIATQKNINFSNVLQNALIKQLHLS